MIRKKTSKPIAEKAEDKVWNEWFDKLGPKDHDKYLKKLGLDDEDLNDFHEEFPLKKKKK